LSWRLLHDWLQGGEPIQVVDEASVSLVRQAVRLHASGLGLARQPAEKLVTAASELAHNQLRHARDGVVAVRPCWRGPTAGLEVIAADRGPGLSDAARALDGGRAHSGGLGIGLSSAYRLVDEMDFDIRLGEGSCIVARQFVSRVARSECAILGRPCQGESISGDQALCLRLPGGVVLAVVDGLGHGPLAREAADQAVQALRQAPEEAPQACDQALRSRRGAAVTVVRRDGDEGLLHQAGVGDVQARVLEASGPAYPFPQGRGVAGQPTAKWALHSRPFPAGSVLLISSDGLRSGLQVDPSELLLAPLILAHRLLLRWGRQHDDALVLVFR
jgi:anti-sigma regulatory factor (Ser/Thr protein kinase)